MKVANQVILVLDGVDGLAASISGGLQPNPTSGFQSLHDSFEFSLESYGIKDRTASGQIVHFINSNGHYEVSILLLQKYESPILACAVNEVLSTIVRENSSSLPSLIVPFIVPQSKFKQETNYSIIDQKVSVYGIKLGPTTNVTQAVSSRLQKSSSSARIYHEELALLLHLVNVIKLPAVVLVGQSSQSVSNKTSEKDLEVICEIGEHLASVSSLQFSKEKIVQNPTKSSRNSKEAWRALYG